jgi:hypothetical protein
MQKMSYESRFNLAIKLCNVCDRPMKKKGRKFGDVLDVAYLEHFMSLVCKTPDF